MAFRTNAGRGSNGHGVALFSGSGSVTTPANQPPATPTISAGTPTSSGVTLTGSAFSDSDVGDTHAASQWQVTTSADTGFASPVISTGDDATNKTSYAVSGLSASTDYLARVRYKDSAGNYSAWSTADAFTTAASGVTQFALDPFTRASSSAALAGLAASSGGTWATNPGSVSDHTLIVDAAAPPTDGVVCHGTASGLAVSFLNGTPPSADYAVEAPLRRNSERAAATNVFGVVARCDAAALTYYSFVYNDDATDKFMLRKSVAGTLIDLTAAITTASTGVSTAIGEIFTLRIEVQGTAIRGLVNDVVVMSATDSDISAAGHVGIVSNNNQSGLSTNHTVFLNFAGETL